MTAHRIPQLGLHATHAEGGLDGFWLGVAIGQEIDLRAIGRPMNEINEGIVRVREIRWHEATLQDLPRRLPCNDSPFAIRPANRVGLIQNF